MNRALLYLWWALLQRRLWEFLRGLRRPTSLIGVGTVGGLLAVMYHFRHEELFGHLVEPKTLAGAAWLMACASLGKGFWQRGLTFAPPDVEFLFTSPFTEQQIVFYRLLPQYLFASVQGVVFAILWAPHLAHPWAAAFMMALFQALCFHLAVGAALLAGRLPEQVHQRWRWMLLVSLALLTALVCRAAWGVRFVPGWVSAPLTQVLFYPAVTLPDLAGSPALHEWAWRLTPGGLAGSGSLLKPLLYGIALALAAIASGWGVCRVAGNLFEPSLMTTTRAAERRQRLEQGRALASVNSVAAGSAVLPALPCFRGVGALVWKNLLVAKRSRRETRVALFLVALYTWGIGALTHSVYAQSPGDEAPQPMASLSAFGLGITLMVAFLAFILQRLFPFDFRRDGHHLEAFRTLPASAWGLVLAEMAVPVAFVLACQAIGLAPLLIFGHVQWPLVALWVLGYPAVALALSAVWNLHYLLSAMRRAAGQAQSATAVGTLMVVALSFLVFAPSGWVFNQLGQHLGATHALPDDPALWGDGFRGGVTLAAGGALGVQYLVDGLLVGLLAWLFARVEVGRSAG